MSTTTTNYGLIKPDTTDPILIGQLNDNADIIDATLKSLSDVLDVAKLGIKYKGEVNYYSNLPASGNEIGDAYTVKYAGSSGTTPDGTEYVWGTVSGTNQWINFSKDSYTKAEVDALLALKQNALTTAQLAAVNSGIDSTKVAQIKTNKNNILLLEQANGAKNALNISTIEKSSNITTTLNSDKTITLSVTSANARSYVYINGNSYIQNVYSNYILVWDNGGNQAINCGVTYSNNGTSWANESFNNTGSSIEINSNYQYLRFSMYFEANTAITNATVKIMLITKSAYNAGFTDYQPYAMSNAELTAAIQAIQAQLANQ